MRLKEFVFLFTKAVNPFEYKVLISRRKRDTLAYFLILLFLCLLTGTALNLPHLLNFPDKLTETMSRFERFNLTGVDIELKEPVVLLGFPRTVLDLTSNRTNMTGETFLITKSSVSWKKFSPDLMRFRIFTAESVPLRNYTDIKGNIENIKGLYFIGFIFLLPSILFAMFAFSFVKYSLIVLLSTIISYLFLRIRRHKARFFTVLRASVFSITVMIVPEVAFSPIFDLSIIPLLVYILFFCLVLFIIHGKDISVVHGDD